MPAVSPSLRLRNITCHHAGLHGLSCDLADGELLVLLGHGGSDVLAMLAGFHRPDAGEMLWQGNDLSAVRPYRRGFGVVFAGKNLFAHLTVAETISLALRRHARRERETRLAWLLDLLRIHDVAALRPQALGPLAARRAALARAIAGAPTLLLLDEPFGGCDAPTTAALAADLHRVRAALGCAVILATRDGPMARALADRIAVLRDGTIVQAGTPRALYDHPADLLVAACLGEINRLPGTLRAVEDGIAEVALDAGPVVEAAIGDVAEPGSRCEILIRPERVALAAASAAELGAGAIPAVIRAIRDHGDHVVVTVAVGGSRLVVRRPSAPGLAIGRNVAIAWQAPHASACRPAAANEPGTAALPHTQASFRVGAAEIADTN